MLAGAAITAGGIYLHSKAYAHFHSPIELWAARSIFGNRINDGEIRSDITLDNEKKLPTFASLQTEVRAWHKEHYEPKIISADEALVLGISNVDTKWHPNPYEASLNSKFFIKTNSDTSRAIAELTVYLPGFVIGISEWSANLSSSYDDLSAKTFAIAPTAHIAKSGLILNFRIFPENYLYIALDIAYCVNQGLMEETQINSTFRLER